MKNVGDRDKQHTQFSYYITPRLHVRQQAYVRGVECGAGFLGMQYNHAVAALWSKAITDVFRFRSPRIAYRYVHIYRKETFTVW